MTNAIKTTSLDIHTNDNNVVWFELPGDTLPYGMTSDSVVLDADGAELDCDSHETCLVRRELRLAGLDTYHDLVNDLVVQVMMAAAGLDHEDARRVVSMFELDLDDLEAVASGMATVSVCHNQADPNTICGNTSYTIHYEASSTTLDNGDLWYEDII